MSECCQVIRARNWDAALYHSFENLAEGVKLKSGRSSKYKEVFEACLRSDAFGKENQFSEVQKRGPGRSLVDGGNLWLWRVPEELLRLVGQRISQHLVYRPSALGRIMLAKRILYDYVSTFEESLELQNLQHCRTFKSKETIN